MNWVNSINKSGTVSKLVTFDTTAIPNHSEYYVETVKDYFRLEKSSTATADGYTIVQPNSGSGRWIRELLPSPEWQNQLTWYIDATNGGDENDGYTSVTALKTYDEFVRRVSGGSGIITPTVIQTVNQIGDYAGSANITVKPQYVGGGLIIQGVLPSASFTGTISAKQNIDPTTDKFTYATSTWTISSEVGRLVFDSTSNLYAWVLHDNGGSQAVLSAWGTVDLSGGLAFVQGNASTSDAINTYALPKLGSINIEVLCGNSSQAQSIVLINNLEITGTPARAKFVSLGQLLVLNNVKLSNFVRFAVGLITLNNCYYGVVAAGTIVGNETQAAVSFAGGAIANGTTGTIGLGSILTMSRQAVLWAGQLIVDQASQLIATDMGVGGSSSPIFLKQKSILKVNTTLWGNATGNDGYGVYMDRGTSIVLGPSVTTLTLNATNGQVALSGNITAPAWDTSSNVFTSNRGVTWANVTTSVAGGGFGSSLIDPKTGCEIIVDS